MRGTGLVYIPFYGISSERALEELKMNGVIIYGVRRTSDVEGLEMVGRILSSNTLKAWDV